MRFLLIPGDDKPYDLRMMIRLGQALCAEGHDAAMMLVEHRNAKSINGFDIVIDVNRPRPDFLNKRSTHIAWVQDLKPEEKQTYGQNQSPSDLIYTMGDADWMGLHYRGPSLAGSLLTGVVEEWMVRPLADVQDIDFGLCAFITWPEPAWDTLEQEILRLCADEVHKRFEPCRGNYRINEAFKITAETFDRWNKQKYDAFVNDPGNVGVHVRPIAEVREHFWQQFAALGGEITKDCARLIDRQTIARLALSVSKSLRLRGFNWELHEEFKPYWKANAVDEEEMFSAKITIMPKE